MEHFNHVLRLYGVALLEYAKDKNWANKQRVIGWQLELARLAYLTARKAV